MFWKALSLAYNLPFHVYFVRSHLRGLAAVFVFVEVGDFCRGQQSFAEIGGARSGEEDCFIKEDCFSYLSRFICVFFLFSLPITLNILRLN